MIIYFHILLLAADADVLLAFAGDGILVTISVSIIYTTFKKGWAKKHLLRKGVAKKHLLRKGVAKKHLLRKGVAKKYI
jgi:hypothetical protein